MSISCLLARVKGSGFGGVASLRKFLWLQSAPCGCPRVLTAP